MDISAEVAVMTLVAAVPDRRLAVLRLNSVVCLSGVIVW